MGTLAAPAPTARPRVSLWTAFWALFGGGVVGLLAASLVMDAIRVLLGLDGAVVRTSFLWQPFPPVGDPARIADLATLAATVFFCGLAARRISRTPESELSLPAATAAVAAIALLAQETRSWWCLLAMIPAAATLRFAAHAPAPRLTWRRRAVAVAAGVAIYAAVTGLAFADLQRHPLAAAADQGCGVTSTVPGGRVTGVCLDIVNEARSRTATVIGIAAGDLPSPSPWRFALRKRAVPPGGVPAGTYTMREIPLRVRAGGDSSTAKIPVSLTASCG